MANILDLTTLEGLSEDFKRLQAQKSRKTGGVEARVLLALAFAWGEQYVSQSTRGIVSEMLDPNKLHLVFNLVGQNVQKLMGRLLAFDPPFKARPDKDDPKALAEAQVVDKVITALDEIVDQPSRIREILYWLIVGGTAFEHIPWIPDATVAPEPQFVPGTDTLLFRDKHTGETIPEPVFEQMIAAGAPKEQFEIFEEVVVTGEVGSDIHGPLTVFLDQSVKSIDKMAPDQMIHLAKIRTFGWIVENFPEMEEQLGELDLSGDLKIVTTSLFQDGDSTASLFLKDMIPTVQGSQDENDPPMAVVVEAYAPRSRTNPNGRYVVYIPDKIILQDGPNPHEAAEIPIVDYHWEPVTTTFWTKDYVTDLIAPQRFINKRLSQMGEQANGAIASKTLLAAGVSKEDYAADEVGVIENGVTETGTPKVLRVDAPQLPTWFLESINVSNTMMKEIAGGKDLTEDQSFPGQLRGPLAVPMMQEILDTQWGPLYQHLGSQLARAKQMRLNRVKQFYPPVRTMNLAGKDDTDEVLVFHTQDILRSGTNYNVTVQRGALLPELRSMREARVMERLNSSLRVLYEDDRTGRIDKSKVSQDLGFGDAGREGREANARKFAQQIIDMLWEAKQVPNVMPFWDHAPMLDELEAAMMTTEFLQASLPTQELFLQRWQAHADALRAEAEQQAAAQQGQMVQEAVAQATQQAAAQAAAETVQQVIEQMRIQAGIAPETQQALSQQLGAQQQPTTPSIEGSALPGPPQF